MLDLDAGIHLDEIELAVLVEKFNCARPGIIQLAHRRRAGFANLAALAVVQGRRGPFLPDLLVAALQRAIALAQMHGMALAIAENLDFNMARLFQIFFEIDRIVAEGRFCLCTGR